MLHGDSNLGDNGRGTKTIRVIKRRSGSDSRSLHQIFSIRWYQSVDCTSEPPKQQLYSAREITAQSTGIGENFDAVQVPFACLHTKSFRIQFEFAEADRDFNHRHLMCGGGNEAMAAKPNPGKNQPVASISLRRLRNRQPKDGCCLVYKNPSSAHH